MDAEVGTRTISALQARNRSQTIMIFVLIGLNFAFLVTLIFVILNQKTIIQPTERNTASFIVGNNSANKEYFIKISDYIVNKMYNVTPLNATQNFEDVLQLTDERTYPKLKSFLTNSANRITKEGITSVWSSTGEYKVDEATKEVIITGVKKSYLADRLVAEQNQKLKLTYTMKNGKIALYSASEVKENEQTPNTP